ncbi:N-acetyl-gamma-glutamyl-phosphate reductase [Acetobacter thailandicus]|uniref:N-acetyl-gamma-glutamyl-phosphate reductase n=1 Tax=Acetobacter thailandicus TaxID=1502842 RepID=UPI001BA7EDAD|nr:N-acetyl-gamma-glutamyl-phosphate reductase [Acetobacter thailandicus]MBS0985485.1 N-acetyl-gamma-glutamyl-phosphate reductase [Acetobacter thailandicus]
MTQNPVIFIDGEAGTTGLEIRQRLVDLPVQLHTIDPAHRKDPAARKEAMLAAELVVLCLPDAASREAAEMMAEEGAGAPRLLDASSAFRTASDWVYGLPELTPGQIQKIASAQRVSNPGCYPTGAIALLRPLIDAGVLDAHYPVSINAVSGYSGGGRAMIEAHEQEGGPAFELYGLGLEHKHVPEIHLHAGLKRRPVFVPSVGHFPRGMIVSVPLHLDDLKGHVTTEDLHSALMAHYAGQDKIKVLPAEGSLSASALAGNDGMELRVHGSTHSRQAVLTARLDNLGKGASGAALQNIALMLGL